MRAHWQINVSNFILNFYYKYYIFQKCALYSDVLIEYNSKSLNIFN